VPESSDLAVLYAGTSPLGDEELRTAANLIDLAGGRTWSQDQAGHLMAKALARLEHLPSTPAATELTDLAHLLTHRTH
jgi:geranylgeranyl diphosphate synthase type I